MTSEQLARAVALQRKCWTHERIAEDLGVCRETVTRNLSRHNRRVLKRLEKWAVLKKAQQVVQLERIAEEAIDGWERSQREVETVKTIEDGEETRTETTRKGQAGAPGFLAEARAAMADIRKLLGLDAPERIAVSADDQPPPRIAIPDRPPPGLAGGQPPEVAPGTGDAPEVPADLRPGGDG